MNRLILLVESRIRGDVYVRFGGELPKTHRSNTAGRWMLSLPFMGTVSDDILSSPTAQINVFRAFRHTELNKYTPFFVAGEEVGIKFTQVNEETFLFWKEYENEVVNNGNPFFPNTSNLPGNIRGGLGIWAGYGVSSYQLHINSTKKLPDSRLSSFSRP